MSKPESFTHEPPMVGTPDDIVAGGWVSYVEHCAIVAQIERERDELLAQLNKFVEAL